MNQIKEHFMQIQNQMDNIVNENNEMIRLILNELEDKIEEAKTMVNDLDEMPANIQAKIVPTQFAVNEELVPLSQSFMEDEIPAANETENQFHQPASNIIWLRQQGFSTREIAEKLNISSGEVDLKINIYEKKSFGFGR